ncbi:hypothetical protein NQ318_010055, partial [Aromia moschata]
YIRIPPTAVKGRSVSWPVEFYYSGHQVYVCDKWYQVIGTRHSAMETGVTKSTVWKVIKKEGIHPYHFTPVQNLIQGDFPARLDFARCGDKTRTQKQVCEVFNTKYPDRRISQSTVSRIENKFREFGNVTDIPKSGRKRILDDGQKLDILLHIQDNPDCTLAGARYLDFLQNFLVPELRMLFPDDDNSNEIDRNIWFQQDGATPHFSLEINCRWSCQGRMLVSATLVEAKEDYTRLRCCQLQLIQPSFWRLVTVAV